MNEKLQDERDAYPYLDVSHLHLELGEDVAVFGEEAAVATQLVATVGIFLLTCRIALALAHVLLIVGLKQKKGHFRIRKVKENQTRVIKK